MTTELLDTPATGSTAPRRGGKRHLGKAVVAGAVAVGLLAAGGGTFSRWYEEQQITGSSLSSGELSMVPAGSVQWRDQKGSIQPQAYRMVPGDTVTFSAPMKITAVGDNLTASLAVDASGVVINDPALAEGLRVSTDVSGLADTNGADGWTVVGQQGAGAGDNGKTVTVTITVQWPATKADGSNWGTDTPDAATGTGAGEATSVDLSVLKVKLTQNA